MYFCDECTKPTTGNDKTFTNSGGIVCENCQNKMPKDYTVFGFWETTGQRFAEMILGDDADDAEKAMKARMGNNLITVAVIAGCHMPEETKTHI